MKKCHSLLRCLPAAAISLTLCLTRAACGVQSASNTGDNASSISGTVQIKTNMDGESLLEMVFTQAVPDGNGRITEVE